MTEEDPMPPRPIYGHVPDTRNLPPVTRPRNALVEQPERKRPGPKPKAKPVNPSDPTTWPGQAPRKRNRGTKAEPEASTEGPACPSCEKPVTSLNFESMKEMLRWSRDRALDTKDSTQRARLGETDLLYIAARLDGFCGLRCWRVTGQQTALSRALDDAAEADSGNKLG